MAIFAQNSAFYNKSNYFLLSQALCVISSLRNSMFKLHISPRTFVVNIKFPRATYHTIVPSTEELYSLISRYSPRPIANVKYVWLHLSLLRTVRLNTEVFLQRLCLWEKADLSKTQLESKKQNAGNEVFFRDN